MTLWERVVQANRPGPPEHSVPFRVASAGTVIIAIAACWSQGEVSLAVALFGIAATGVGNVLSYWRREHPWPAVKPILAVCAVGGFVWFIATVSHNATPGDISTVESPLAVLFAWVLCTHAFDVPARRDVAYSLAGSAALMAVAAAQSVDLTLGVYVVAWVACGLWGLVAMWQSMAGARGVPWMTLAVTGVAVAVVALLLVSVLPAPKVSTSLIFPSAAANSSSVDSPSNLTDGSASLPAHAASPSGRTGVGGFLGFAKSLDTGARASLGNEVVLRVRASRPSFWVGQTYDYWDGQSWVQAQNPANGGHLTKLDFGSPFEISLQPDQQAPLSSGTLDVQTFYLAQSGPNLVFHADNAQRVYIQSRSLFLTGDGTIASASSMGAGTVYTVVSDDVTATPEQLRQSTLSQPSSPVPQADGLPRSDTERYLQLPHAYPRVAAMARQITAGIGSPVNPDTYDKVSALESWMSTHVRYSTDIPPLAPGADAVSSFLFGTRRGYCEQISTASVVMLRSLGIPARETVGYVPGSYNPITDLYDVQAKDAHAWVQVWFPGYGWQNFDPTAVVPLANPSPGSVLAHSTTRFLAHLPWIPIALVVALGGTVALLRRRRRLRPPTWAHQVAGDLERGGRRRGQLRRTDETLTAYGERLGDADPAATRRTGGGHHAGGTVHLRRHRAGRRPDHRGAFLHPLLRRRRPPGAAGRGRPAGPGRWGAASGARDGQRLVERGPGGQQGPVGHQVPGPAEGQGGPEPVAPPVQRHQLALLHRAFDHHHLVVGPRKADDLDLGRVLVGPEERHGLVGLGRRRPGQQVAGRGSTPLGRIGPVLHPELLAQPGVGPPGHVPGRHHPVGGEQGLAAHHPVLQGQAGALQPPDGGHHTDPHHDDVGRQLGTVGQVDRRRCAPAGVGRHPRDAHPGPDGHALGAVQPGTGLAHGVAQHPAEGGGQGLDHGDLGAQPPAGRRHLRADEAGPDDHHPRPFPGRQQGVPDGPAVVEGAQGPDGGLPFGTGQGTGDGTGGHDEAVERQFVPVVGQERPGVEVDPGGPPAQPEFEAQGVEGVRGVMVDPGDVPGAGQ